MKHSKVTKASYGFECNHTWKHPKSNRIMRITGQMTLPRFGSIHTQAKFFSSLLKDRLEAKVVYNGSTIEVWIDLILCPTNQQISAAFTRHLLPMLIEQADLIDEE